MSNKRDPFTFLVDSVHEDASEYGVDIDYPPAILGHSWRSVHVRIIAERCIAYVIQDQLPSSARSISVRLASRRALDDG